MHRQLLAVWRAREDLSGFHGRVKCAIELQGRMPGLARHPFRPASQDERVLIGRTFQEANLPVAVPEPA
jgi:hypothetical protein